MEPAVRTKLADFPRFFTPYAFTAAVLLYLVGPANAPALVAETIRALAAFVALAAAYVHVAYDCSVVRRFYDRVFPKGTPHVAMVAIEVTAHFLPPLLVGPPQDPRAIAAAYAIVAAWYIAQRDRIHRLYLDEIPIADYDRLLLGVLPLAAVAWSVALKLTGA